jgi:phosphoglycolate phosphatase-like HAD superfamily hydrolase
MHSIMLGDTPYDVEAAARARVPAIALRCGGWWGDDAFAAAAAVYDDPADLLAHYDDSPLGAAMVRAEG